MGTYIVFKRLSSALYDDFRRLIVRERSFDDDNLLCGAVLNDWILRVNQQPLFFSDDSRP